MRPSSFLHELIQTMTAKEKAGFEKLLQEGKKGDNGLYLKLFQFLSGQREYDESAVRHAFAGTSFGKSLGFPKSHLYDRLLDYLQGVEAGENPASRLRRTLDQAELLAEKGLPAQALRLIERGLQMAEELEDAGMVLQFLRLKRRQVMRLQPHQLSAEIASIAQVEAEWEMAFQQTQTAIRLHDALYSLFQEVRRKTRVADDPHLQGLWGQLEELLGRADLRFPARVAALRARSHIHHMREDFQAVHDAYQAEIQAWEAHPMQIQHGTLRYLRLISQWLTSKALIGDDAGLLDEIQRLRSRADLDPRSAADVFQTTYNLELYYYLNAGRAGEALVLVPAVAQGLQRFDSRLPPDAKLGFYYNLALVHWLSGQASGALKWVHRIQQFEKGAVRKDIREFAPLLEKVLHYELGNTSVLESWFRAARYRRRKGGEGIDLERVLMGLIHGLLGPHDGEKRVRLMAEFRAELDRVSEQPGMSRLGIQELREWSLRN